MFQRSRFGGYVAPTSTNVFTTILSNDVIDTAQWTSNIMVSMANTYSTIDTAQWTSNMMVSMANTYNTIYGTMQQSTDEAMHMARFASNNSAFASNLAKWVSVSLSNVLPDADINILSMQADLEVVLNTMSWQLHVQVCSRVAGWQQ
jgi:hypothetical protein